MRVLGAALTESRRARSLPARRLNLRLLLKNPLVPFLRELLLLGAVVIGAIVLGAVVIRSGEPDNPVHLAFQGGFNDCRLALSASDAAHVRRVQFELAGDAAVKAPEEGCEVEGRCTHAAFDFCHHSCYFLSRSLSDRFGAGINVTGMLYQSR